MERGGIFGAIIEAGEIQQQLGCSSDEAFEIQRKRARERLEEYERSIAESNVVRVDFRSRQTA